MIFQGSLIVVCKREKKLTPCWEWKAYCNPDGYGRIWTGRIYMLAHRRIYELFFGKIPKGLTLDHLCRNRSCVNPKHLEPVTHKENLLRSELTIPGINIRKMFCIRNHPYIGNNLKIKKDGSRLCNACLHIGYKRRWKREKERRLLKFA